MIHDIDRSLEELISQAADPTWELHQAEISFDLPDATWRASINALTVNCYLYDIRENRHLRTTEPLIQRSPDSPRAIRRRPPVRIDCAYCITAWSPATDESTLDEHRLLSQVLMVLLRHPTIPPELLQGSLAGQIPPYPTVIASPDGVKNQPEFWGALDQQLKPSLNYVVTLAVMVDEPPEVLPIVTKTVYTEGHPLPALISVRPSSYAGPRDQPFDVVLRGKGTHFSATTVVRLEPVDGVTVDAWKVQSPTVITVTLTVHAAALERRYTIQAITGAETATRENGFGVQAP